MANAQPMAPMQPAMNPGLLSNPDYMQQMMQAQRTQALAQALQEQGTSPIEFDPRGRISPWQGINKLASALLGGYEGQLAMKQQAGLNATAVDQMRQQYGAGQASPGAQALQAQAQQTGRPGLGPTPEAAATIPMRQGWGQQQGLSGSVTPTPANPLGLNPDLLVAANMGNPVAKAHVDALMKNYEQTPEIKNNNWQGIDPATARSMTIADATKKGFYEFPAGQAWTNTLTGAGGYSPSLPANAQPSGQFTPGSPIPSVAGVPGAAEVLQANARGQTLGNTAGGVHTVTNPDGSQTTGLGGDLFKISAAQQAAQDAEAVRIMRQERSNPNNTPETNAGLDREIARMSGGRTYSGPSTTDSAIQKANADSISALPAQVTQSRQAVTGLESALNVLQGVKATGPGTGKAVNWGALLNNFGIPLGKDNVENYQLAQKFLANSLNTAAAGTGASGSDARFDSFSHGQPNADTMDKAPLESAVRYVLSQHDANIARGSFIANVYAQAKQAGDPNAAQTAQQRWSQVYNPQYFSFNRMSPAEQASFLKSQGSNARNWVQGYNNYAAQTGWVH